MIEAKYIITEDFKPIIFSKAIPHKVFKNLNPSSAGFIHISELGDIHVYGSSISLGIESQPLRDSEIIETLLMCDREGKGECG